MRHCCIIGGTGFIGSHLADAMVRRGVKNLSVVANDTAAPGKGIGKLISAGAVKKVIASHIGLNRETQQKTAQLLHTVIVSGLGPFYERTLPCVLGTRLPEQRD